MAIVLKCGFEAISYEIRGSLKRKGDALYESGHVSQVQEESGQRENMENFDPNSQVEDLSTIRGRVLPQTSISAKPYAVLLKVNKKREVVFTLCECKAGQGTCKHIAALITFINNEKPDSCTSNPMSWLRPAANLTSYKKGKKMEDLFPQKIVCPSVSKDPPSFTSSTDGLGAFSIMLRAQTKKETVSVCSEVLTGIIDKIVADEQKQGVFDTCETMLRRQNEHVVYKALTCEFSSDSKLKLSPLKFNLDVRAAEGYNSNIPCTGEDLKTLCLETLGQSECKKWFRERKIRISSTACHRIKTRQGNFESLCEQLINAKSFSNCATNYGRQMEKKARLMYSVLYNVEVEEVGLVVNTRQPFLCCSPDGVIKTPEIEIIEIKCPYSCRNDVLIDYEKCSSNLPYIQFQNNTVSLKETHCYYTQIQISLYVLGAKKCHLFVYSPKQHLTLCIHRNEKFLSEVIPKVQLFYFRYYLNSLIAHGLL